MNWLKTKKNGTDVCWNPRSSDPIKVHNFAVKNAVFTPNCITTILLSMLHWYISVLLYLVRLYQYCPIVHFVSTMPEEIGTNVKQYHDFSGHEDITIYTFVSKE